ncbi:DUF6281 family protein [Streptomyces sp. NPDC093252]|uniref:DUF6281 family protein n=1 Tax=Streptomyces sp. NPDC093252 TaxID=3154980 RepID=UPI00343CF21F
MKPLVMAGGRRRRIPLAALAAAAAAAATASCASPSGGETEPGSASACEYRVEYGTRTYTDLAHADFTIGEALGSATVPPCDDSPGDGDGPPGPPESTTAYAVEGLDPAIAIALSDAPDGVLFVVRTPDGDLPPDVERLIADS